MGKLFLILLFVTVAGHAADTERPMLTVYTYDSFASQWGPGPRIKQNFERECGCELKFVAVDGSTGILSRVQLEGASSRADVVLGLDNSLIIDAQKTGLLAAHEVDLAALDVPFAWDDPVFLPFDYGYFAFIYNRDKLPEPPRSFHQLAADDALKIVIQDPRSSTPGLGLVLWVKAVFGDRAFDLWRDLADNILTVTKSWAEAYGLFLDGEADMVLSYTTSPAYHMLIEGDDKYQAAGFGEGHGMQIEVAARLKNAPQPELARRFMRFIVADGFQSAIPTGNWMYPVTKPRDGLPSAFNTLLTPATRHIIHPQRIADHKAAWVDEFSRALSE